MFQYILWGSVFLAVLSIIVMLVLIFRRYYLQWVERKKQSRIAILKPKLFKCLEDINQCEVLLPDPNPSDKKLILGIIRQLMDALRGETQDALIELMKKFGAQENYLHDLHNGNESSRVEAAEDLANFDQPEVIEALLQALSDPKATVRFSAAYALEKLGVEFNIIKFLEKFIKDGAKRPRAMRDLLRKLAPKNVAGLISLTANENDDIAVLAVDALSQSGDLNIIKHISKIATKHSSKEVRASAMRTLAALGHPAAEGAVMKALKDPCWEVRAQAAITAGRIGLVKTDKLLVKLLSDAQWWVRFRAAEGLYNLGPKGVKMIEKAVHKGGIAGEVAEFVLMEKSGV